MALPQVSLNSKEIPYQVKDARDIKTIEKMLEKFLKDFEDAKSEMLKMKLLNDGAIKLINTLETMNRTSQQESLFGVVDRLIDILMVVSDAGKKVKQCLISSLAERFMDSVICPKLLFIHKMEILKSFNTVLENCPCATKQKLLTQNSFTDKIKLLCKATHEVGDYELQVCIIEFLFRLIPRSLRANYLKSFICDNEDLFSEFLGIQDSRFETDCRTFLNKLNMQNISETSSIYSFPAKFVKLDGIKLFKPADEDYDEFWVDFNVGSKRIGIFCEPNALSSQQSQYGEHLWETVSVWARDVNKFTCTAEGKVWKAAIELKPGAQMLSNKEADDCAHLLIIGIPNVYELRKAMEDTLQTHHKVSCVDSPVCIVQDIERNPTCSVRSKVSVPLEPMTTPASSVISSCEYTSVWKNMEEKVRRQKVEVAKALPSSDLQEVKKPIEKNIACKEIVKEGLHVDTITATGEKVPDCVNINVHEINIDCKDSTKCSVASGIVCKNESDELELSAEASATCKNTEGRSLIKKKPNDMCSDTKKHNKNARTSIGFEDVNASGKDSCSLRRSQRNRRNVLENTGSNILEPEVKESKKSNSSQCTNMSKKNNAIDMADTIKKNAELVPHDELDSKNVKNLLQPEVITDSLPSAQLSYSKLQTKIGLLEKTPGRQSVDEKSKFAEKHPSVNLAEKSCDEKRKRNGRDMKKNRDLNSTQQDSKIVEKDCISPGNMSVDDFKPSKTFKSMGDSKRKILSKSKVKKPKKLKRQKENRVIIRKEQYRNADDEISHENSAENSVKFSTTATTLKDFLPSLQREKLKSESKISKTTSNGESSFSTKLQCNVQPKSSINPSYVREFSAEEYHSSGEIPGNDFSRENKTSINKPEVSSSGSGELYIEVECTQKAGKGSDVIAETQLDSSPQLTFDMEDKLGKDSIIQSSEMSRNYKLGKKDTETLSDYHSFSGDKQVSLNFESSYVFNKSTCVKVKPSTLKPITDKNKKVTVNETVNQQDSHLSNLKSNKQNSAMMFDKLWHNKKSNSRENTTPRSLTTCDLKSRYKESEESDPPAVISKLGHNLRSRNKAISYKESESGDVSLSEKEDSKDVCSNSKTSQIRSKLNLRHWNNRSKMSSDSQQISQKNFSASVTPIDRIKRPKEDQMQVNRSRSHAPKMLKTRKSEHHNIWTSQRVEKVVTRVAYSRCALDSGSLDPYDFEAECGSKSEEQFMYIPPLLHTSCQNLNENSSSCEKLEDKQSKASKSFTQSVNFKGLGKMNKSWSNLMNMGSKSCQEVNQNGNSTHIYQGNKTCRKPLIMLEKNIHKHKLEEPADLLAKKLLQGRETHVLKPKEYGSGSNSDGGSSKFGLYASQNKAQKSEPGLVFPRLDDSIPCTPFEEKDIEEDLEITGRKSLSDVSWLTKGKTPPVERQKKRGKTYNRNKKEPINTKSASVDGNREFGPLYSNLHLKMVSKTSATTPKSKRYISSKKQKTLSPLDIITLPNQTPSFVSKESSKIRSAFEKSKHIDSLLSSSRDIFIPEAMDCEDETNAGNYLMHSEIGKLPIKQNSIDAWNVMSLKIDNHLQEVIERLSENMKISPCVKSGPSSCKRLTKSELKRKYPDISSTSGGATSESEAHHGISDEDSLTKPRFTQRKLFKTAETDEIRAPVEPSTQNTDISFNVKNVTCGATSPYSENIVENIIFMTSEATYEKQNKTSSVSLKSVGAKQNNSSHHKLDFSPLQQFRQKCTSPTKTRLSFCSFDISQNSPPEKERLHNRSSSLSKHGENRFYTSPLLSVVLSPCISPDVAFSHTSPIPELDSCEQVDTASTSLLDTIKQDLMKATMSQISDGSSGSSVQLTDEALVDIDQTSADWKSLKEYIGKKKIDSKSFLGSSDVESTIQSTYKVFNSTDKTSRISVNKFQGVVHSVLENSIKDMKKVADTEVKAAMLWAQQMEKLRNFKMQQTEGLNKIRKAHREMKSDLQGIQKKQENNQVTLKTALKKDIDDLKRKLLKKYHDQSLEVMQRRLQASFMY